MLNSRCCLVIKSPVSIMAYNCLNKHNKFVLNAPLS
jgi:hypothetical protein